jgi:hypothetical protein
MNKITPYQNAKSAFDCWVFSLYLKYGFEQGKICSEIFKDKLEFKSDGEVVISLKPKYSEINTIGLSQNLMSYMLGTCFITFDEALKDTFGDIPEVLNDNDIDALRAIIYMMRCANAHSPSKPKWRIDKQKYKRLFVIKEIDFKIDFRDLNGNDLVENHHNGLSGLSNLMKYALNILKKHST